MCASSSFTEKNTPFSVQLDLHRSLFTGCHSQTLIGINLGLRTNIYVGPQMNLRISRASRERGRIPPTRKFQ